MEFKEMLNKTDKKITVLSEELKVPYRTMQDWCSGKRVPPEWAIALIKNQLIIKFKAETIGKTAFTAGYGDVPVCGNNEPFVSSNGWNDAKIDGVWYCVGDADDNGFMIEVRERPDGSLFAFIDSDI